MILNLGVIDLPYNGEGAITTAGVAKILEEKYSVIGTYASLHIDDIAKNLEESVAGVLDNILIGIPPGDPFAEAEDAIEKQFKFQFLGTGEIEGKVPGTPTKASIDRKSSRFKKGKAKNTRPSFIDTGLYQSAFKVWVEE